MLQVLVEDIECRSKSKYKRKLISAKPKRNVIFQYIISILKIVNLIPRIVQRMRYNLYWNNFDNLISYFIYFYN